MIFCAISIMLVYLRRMNQNSIELAIKIKMMNQMPFREDNSSEGKNEDNDEVIGVELPRKITLFRVLMERKLGIDFEHSRESISNESL